MSKFDELVDIFESDDLCLTTEADKPTILVIDDDSSIRRGLSRSLNHQYNVKTAGNGQDGIDTLDCAFHCIILDVKMGNMNGFEAYPKLKAKCPDVPIIFFTAFQSEHDLQDVINKYKPEGYVEKGKDITFLENLLKNAVSKYKLYRENENYKRNLEIMVEERTKELKIALDELKSAHADLGKEKIKVENAQKILSRFLARQLVEKILHGEFENISGHQRRKLTIFFSDIKDFTKTTDAMEPEDLANLINEYCSHMIKIVYKYEGTLAQIAGDGLYVFFGAPEYRSDKEHALRCVEMAIEMQKQMRVLKEKWYNEGIDLPFEIRCGINTGMATVGGFGSEDRKEYAAIGMPVNIAARLEMSCPPGAILLSHSTWAYVKNKIECEEFGKIEIKGFHKKIRTYTVKYQ